MANPGAASTTVTLDGSYTLMANFSSTSVTTYTLNVSSGPGGSVNSPGEGAFTYAAGTSVSVVAAPQNGYTFTGWSGTAVTAGRVANPGAASTTVTLDGNYTLVASFSSTSVTTYTLSISSTAGGQVTTPGEGSFSYAHGQSVTLQAKAEPGYYFVEWSGSFFSSSNPAFLEMDADHHITANFAPVPPALTISSGEGGYIAFPGEGDFVYGSGTRVRAVAVPEPGYVFLGWTGTLVQAGALLDPEFASADFIVEETDATLHASFTPALRCLYVDDDAAEDPSPYTSLFGDPAEDGSWEHPFDSLQEAIDMANTGDAILVLPGTYREHIRFSGKDLTVSAFDCCTVGSVSRTILTGTDADSVVTFDAEESAAAVLTGFTISRGGGEWGGGIRCTGSDPIIANCLIVGNRADVGGGIYCEDSRAMLTNCTVAENVAWDEGGGLYCDGDVMVVDSIFCGNWPQQIVADPCQVCQVVFSNVRGGWSGQGNLDCDPRFVMSGYWALPVDTDLAVSPNDPAAIYVSGDYHLKAKEGRWNGWSWIRDGWTSRCIDAGNPHAGARCEPVPNGGRLNMGAFGGTAEASRSDVQQ